MFAPSAGNRLGCKDLRRCVDLFTASDQRQVTLAGLGARNQRIQAADGARHRIGNGLALQQMAQQHGGKHIAHAVGQRVQVDIRRLHQPGVIGRYRQCG